MRQSDLQQSTTSRIRSNSFDLFTSITINTLIRDAEQIVSIENDHEDAIVIKKVPLQVYPIRLLDRDQLVSIVAGGYYDPPELAATLIQRKIPFPLRKAIWKRIASNSTKPNNFNYNQCNQYSQSLTQINKDVYRSNIDNALTFEVEKYVGTLRRILVAYSNYDPEVGYTQGMNLIAGMIIVLMSIEGNDRELIDFELIEEEEELFWMFAHIMKNQRDVFLPQVPGLHQRLNILQKLLEKEFPELIPFLAECGISDIQMCFSQFYLCMVMQRVSKKFARFVFQMYLIFGENFLQNLILQAIMRNKKKILSLKDISQLMPFFRDQMFANLSIEFKRWRHTNQLIQELQKMKLFKSELCCDIDPKPTITKTKKERFFNKLFQRFTFQKQ